MHTLIISGSPWCPIQQAQTLLEHAGLHTAQPATTHSISNMQVWYSRLFAGTPHPASPQQPGKPWELAAGEIFLANWDQPAWGWADTRSTWLLDFWRQFDPSTRFVLLHTPAQDILAQALTNLGSRQFDSKVLLATWCNYQTEFLRFYHRNRSHCVLAHTHQALQQPNEWVQTLNAELGTSLTPNIAISWPLPQPDPLQHLLVQRILQDHPEVQALEEEINATLPTAINPAATQPAPDPAAASATLRLLYISQADLQQDCDALKQCQTEQNQEICTREDTLSKEKAALTAARDAEAKAKTEALAQRDAETKAKAEAQAQRDALSKDKAALSAARDAEATAKAQALAQRDQLTQEKAKLIAEGTALASARDQLATQRDAEVKAKTEAQAQRDAELKAKLEAITQRDTQTQALKDQQQESELLLLQLHQVQEELEQYFLAGQDLKTQMAANQKAQEQLTKDKAALSAARDAEAKAKTEAQAQRDALSKEKATLSAARDAEATAKAQALGQRDQLTQEKAKLIAEGTALASARDQLATQRDAEAKAKTEALAQRDAETKAKAEAQAQRDALSKDKAALSAARDAEAKAKVEALAQRDAENKAKTEAQAQRDTATQALKDQQQESELLLLQLHQVQEELEHYFLQHQQANHDKQELNTRLTKLLQRYPDYNEWDRIELIPTSAKKTQLHCQIHGLKAGTRSAPVLDLTVALVNKHPVLLLTPPALPASNPLLYWPTSPAADNAAAGQGASLLAPLQLDPAAAPGTEASQHLRSLTQSDLHLLGAACKTLTDGLPTTMPQRSQWVQHLNTLAQQFSTLPPVWRFDTVQLKHNQVNPDYEHLWFELSNASFGRRHWPRFEFRLSAANIKKGQFSQYPKLEFPKPAQGEPQFENWFEESEDDRGAKFELRFDIKTQSLDVNTWHALSPLDQAQALSLCTQLPVLLQRLQAQGTPLARPWADWHTLATAIVQAFKHSLTAPAHSPRPLVAA